MRTFRLALCALAFAAFDARAQGETLGTTQQGLTGAELVDVSRQRELGLVAVSTGCSGTLLNRYWVLTADHCLSNNGTEIPPSEVQIRAAWTTRVGRPVRYVRYGGRGLDVALIQIREEIDYTGMQLIYHLEYDPDAGSFLTKYGRGISGFATGAGASATPAPSDGNYRMLTVEASVSTNQVITIPATRGGGVGHGGDSGGPDWVTASNGSHLGIASVQSSCVGQYMPGQREEWRWATSISSCNSAPLITLRAEILQTIRDLPPRWGDLNVAAANSGAVAAEFDAVSRSRNTMELWWVGPGGAIESAYWYEGANWRRQQIAPANSASTNGAVSAVSRRPNTMEIWWIGAQGSIENAYWYEGGAWARQQIAPAGAAATQGAIASLSRQPNTMEFWWIGPQGSIEGAYWYEGGRWERYQVAPAGAASLDGGIAALSRAPNTMELWWVSPRGAIEGAYWYEGGRWGRHQIAPDGSAAPHAKIAAVARRANTMEIWWAGPQGSIEGAYWYEGRNWGRHRIAAPGSAHTQTAIAALSRRPDTLEIWWSAPDGALRDAYWYEGGAWGSFPLTAAGRVSTRGGITALSRFGDTMEVWFAGPDGAIRDVFFYD